MATTDCYLMFDGTCAEAMALYQKVTGGKMTAMMKMGDAPGCENIPADAKDLIMHACIELDAGRLLMASDSMPGGPPFQKPQGFGVALTYETPDECRRAFKTLSEGGKVDMPLDKTFWAEAFGCVTDRFGTPWMISGGMIPLPKTV